MRVLKAARLLVVSVLLMALGLPALAADAPLQWLRGRWQQGELLIGRVPSDSTVRYNGTRIRVGGDGRFAIGLDRDAAGEAVVEVDLADGRRHQERHPIESRQYSIQRLTLPPDKVNPPPEVTARIEREAAKVREARSVDSDRDDYASAFVWPCVGRISGVYGSQRILNGEKKQPHYGVDVAVPTGTPIKAPAGGIVTLAEPDLYFTGGTLMIDHGHGLVSAFLHLSSLSLQVGDKVEQGQVIGRSGATGRATGPHLDWRISWFDTRVDPQRLVPAMPSSKPASKSKPTSKLIPKPKLGGQHKMPARG